MKYLTILLILLGGCITSKNAPGTQEKLIDKFPKEVIPVIRRELPCVTGVPDSAAYWKAKHSLDSLAEVNNAQLNSRAQIISNLFQRINELRADSITDNAELNKQLEDYAALVAEDNAALRMRVQYLETLPPVVIPVPTFDSAFHKAEKLKREAAELELAKLTGEHAGTLTAYAADKAKWKGSVAVKLWLLILIGVLLGLIVGAYTVYKIKKAPLKVVSPLMLSIVMLSGTTLSACTHINDTSGELGTGLWVLPLIIGSIIFFLINKSKKPWSKQHSTNTRSTS